MVVVGNLSTARAGALTFSDDLQEAVLDDRAADSQLIRLMLEEAFILVAPVDVPDPVGETDVDPAVAHILEAEAVEVALAVGTAAVAETALADPVADVVVVHVGHVDGRKVTHSSSSRRSSSVISVIGAQARGNMQSMSLAS